MKKKNSLFLSVPRSCNQPWEDMTVKDDGRFCDHCQHTVVDFSQMTDKELLAYFAAGNTVACGRFHNAQLNRNIEYIGKKHFIPAYFKKIAATLATVISLARAEAQPSPGNKENAEVLQCNTGEVKKDTALPVKVIISGEVRYADGGPVKNAKISSPLMQNAYTDANGRFSFALAKEQLMPQHFAFSYDSMVTVVRSYHPAMESTGYSITLYKVKDYPYAGSITMGGVRSDMGLADLPSILFKRNEICLLKNMKALLAHVATAMKNNPGASIVVQLIQLKLYGARQ